jgi:cytochrome c oxidase assembly protein subunit 15
VSHFRLTAHLGIALAIFSAELWLALTLLAPQARRAHAPLARAGLLLAALVFVMALSGGFVAGLHAGRAYNTFPLMNGRVVPPEIMMLDPWYRNFLYNLATVQFVHRSIAWLLALLVPLYWWRVQRAGLETRARLASDALLAALVVQLSLGVATLLLVVPVPLAAAHQAGAVLLLAATLWTASEMRHALPADGRSFA